MQTEIIFEQNDVFIHGQFDSTIFGKIQILKTNSNYDSEFVWMPDPPKTEIKEEKIEIEIEIEKENEKEQNTNEQETEKEKEQEKEKEKEKEKEVQKKEEEEKEKTQQTKNSLSGIIKRKIIDLTSFEILALNENESCMILNDTNSIDYPPFNFLSKEGLSDLLNFLLGEMLIRKSTKNENLYYPNKPKPKKSNWGSIFKKKIANMMEVIEKERNKVRVKTFTEEEHLKLLEYFQDIRINTVKAMKKNQVNIEIFDQSVLNSLLDKDGKIIDENLFKAIVMFKPIEKTIRPIIWKYILGFYKFDSTSEENEMISQQGEKKYDIIKNQWQTFDEVQIANNKKFQKTVTQIDKDITRTDRKVSIFQDENSEGIQILRRILISHGIYNFDLG
ncbi:rabgap/tbc domain-containing protein [Anaeramoeba flamelloides]|uniref:Rabgap/tbc domain-containing protein n=1 Tax=Anaeramoeba flamelloides TaxID=1746091 RepID=A0ABQ8YCS6_9EUKA|nr:rabgap/tbc domain-containing protein [Anaeramoeba flamelloides]